MPVSLSESELPIPDLPSKASFNAGPVLEDKSFTVRSRAEALHYRVDASGYKFFDRGTAGGVL